MTGKTTGKIQERKTTRQQHASTRNNAAHIFSPAFGKQTRMSVLQECVKPDDKLKWLVWVSDLNKEWGQEQCAKYGPVRLRPCCNIGVQFGSLRVMFTSISDTREFEWPWLTPRAFVTSIAWPADLTRENARELTLHLRTSADFCNLQQCTFRNVVAKFQYVVEQALDVK